MERVRFKRPSEENEARIFRCDEWIVDVGDNKKFSIMHGGMTAIRRRGARSARPRDVSACTERALPLCVCLCSCDGADRVTAYITVGGNKEKIDDFCGSGTPRELMSNSATMSLHFHSTAVSRGARGFKARYAFVSSKKLRPSLSALIDCPCSISSADLLTPAQFFRPSAECAVFEKSA